jgi:hypothetical protein
LDGQLRRGKCLLPHSDRGETCAKTLACHRSHLFEHLRVTSTATTKWWSGLTWRCLSDGEAVPGFGERS